MKTHPKLRLFRYLLPVVIVLALIFSVRYCGKQEKPLGHPRDYAAIAKEGILHVATEYNSISFYVDSDTVSGFHYELIEAFARDKGLKTEITPVMSLRRTAERIKRRTLRCHSLRNTGNQRTERFSASHLPHHTQQAGAGATKSERGE